MSAGTVCIVCWSLCVKHKVSFDSNETKMCAHERNNEEEEVEEEHCKRVVDAEYHLVELRASNALLNRVHYTVDRLLLIYFLVNHKSSTKINKKDNQKKKTNTKTFSFSFLLLLFFSVCSREPQWIFNNSKSESLWERGKKNKSKAFVMSRCDLFVG